MPFYAIDMSQTLPCVAMLLRVALLVRSRTIPLAVHFWLYSELHPALGVASSLFSDWCLVAQRTPRLTPGPR